MAKLRRTESRANVRSAEAISVQSRLRLISLIDRDFALAFASLRDENAGRGLAYRPRRSLHVDVVAQWFPADDRGSYRPASEIRASRAKSAKFSHHGAAIVRAARRLQRAILRRRTRHR